MRFLFISKRGIALPIAHRVKREGNEVDVFVKNLADPQLYQGLLELLPNLGDAPAKADVVVFDEEGAGAIADGYAARGIPVFGAAGPADNLRDMLASLNQSPAGMPQRYQSTATQFTSNSFDELTKRLRQRQGRYLFKADSFEYLAETSEEMIRMLDYLATVVPPNTELSIDRLEPGVLIGIFFLCDGVNFVRPVYVASEEHESLTNVTETEPVGILLQRQPHEVPAVTEVGVRIKGVLDGMGGSAYRGPIYAKCFVSQRGITIKSVAARLAHLSSFAVLDDPGMDVARFIYEVAAGRLEDMEVYNERSSVALALKLPGDEADKPLHDGLPILGVHRANLEHVWMVDARLDEREQLVTTGANRTVLIATATNSLDILAIRSAANLVEHIRVPYATHRVNIAERAYREFGEFRIWMPLPVELHVEHVTSPVQPAPPAADDNSGLQ